MSSKRSKGTKRKAKPTPPPQASDDDTQETKFQPYQPRGEAQTKKKGKSGPKFDKFQLGSIAAPCVVLQVFDDQANEKTFGATVAVLPGDASTGIAKNEQKMSEFQAFMTDDGELSSTIKLEPVLDHNGIKWNKVNLKFNRDDKCYFTDTKGVLHAGEDKENISPADVGSIVPGRVFVATVNPSSWTWGKGFGVSLYANRVLVGPMDDESFDLSDLGSSVKEPEWV